MKVKLPPDQAEVGKLSSTSDDQVHFRVKLLKKTSLLAVIVALTMVDIAAALLSSSRQGDKKIREIRRPSTHGRFLNVQIKPPSLFSSTMSNQKTHPTFLIPSQVLKAHPSSSSSSSATPIVAAPTGNSNPNQKRKRRRRKASSSMTSSNTTNTSRPSKSGNLPDIFWRSIPMKHLRYHPNFEPLPLPETIRKLESLEDIRLFRQESWQWDAVHEGRCTTSQAVAALGFLEPEAGKILGVPRSWQRGGLGAYHRLRKSALRTLDDMNEVLCKSNFSIPTNDIFGGKDSSLWTTPTTGFPFAAKYMVRMTQSDRDERRKMSQAMSNSPGFDFSIRMMWGNSQEATALLTALNYFWKQDSGVVLKEVGMCGGGLQTNHTTGDASSLLVGATPDGLICYPNGTIEALEVKNHCPFFPAKAPKTHRSSQRHSRGNRFIIRHFDFDNAGVPSQYIPQLMMEMLCVGDNCKSAIMVRLTATSGALILRVRRDDEWISEMLYWLNRFQLDFVEREEPPPPNFFLECSSQEDRERYTRFLQKTLDIQKKVELVASIPHSEIQRATASQAGMSNLFLD